MRQPTIFLSHGGGPSFWLDGPMARAFDGLKAYLGGLLDDLPERPRAILVVSAHWEEPRITLGSAPAPAMIFDYYGFPAHAYRLSYPAPGAPELAERARGLLAAAGVDAALDPTRGFDHGVFVPMLIVDPGATIPIVTLSLRQDLDPAFHIGVGAALAPLREEGVLILGSGNSFHNIRAFFDGEETAAAGFDAWLTEAATKPEAKERDALLERWRQAPFARDCHPREEHLLPLMVVAGAAGADVGRRVFHDSIAGKAISGFAFG
ncbi:dioxygenase [Methylosinus sp. H3A]|uniref:DODA-type extradiol aromatic ring-opening family dioxygenase n=1 Tax=Methylosinus sp. H3A TaxID=2785786 RepID=UPI0018C213F3|nr:class III extradiol ring-cleavage dioxygenase [Methylosinus sp. H3A]MBG0812278.1 dioxygenase [Methylosinus sp. H3A]